MGVHNVLKQIEKATARGDSISALGSSSSVAIVDSAQLKMGTDDDVVTAFDGTNVEVKPATDDAGAYNFGDGTTDIDVKMFLGSTTEYALFDVGDSLLNLFGVGLKITGVHAAGQALIIGTGISTPVTWTGDSLIEWHGRLSTATSNDAMFRCRASAPASTAMTSGGAVVAGQFQAYGTDTNDVAQLNAVQGHCGIKANCTIIDSASPLPDMVGGWFKIEDLGFDLTLTGPAAALVLGTQFNAGTTLTGVCDWIFLMKEGGLTGGGGVPDAIIRGYDGTGGGLANFLLDIPASLPWDASDSSGTQSGKIAVNIGGSTKYIQTYSD